ncbi:MAG: magnesium transporter [Elusimicrobiota bacterium]|jgi:magnesium transporter|nr:magnesium transporter [Elusimicrobiota bacterium]
MKNNSLNIIPLLLPEIKDLIRMKKFWELRELLTKIHYMDIAEKFEEFDDNEKIIIFRLLNEYTAIEVFESLAFGEQNFLLKNLKNIEISDLLNDMSSDERVDLFQELSQEDMNKLFSLMKKEEVEDVKTLLKYPDGTAGSLMTTDFVKMSPNITTREALFQLQEDLKAGDSEHIYSSYICDENSILLGAVDLQQLVKNGHSTILKDIMTDTNNIKVNALAEGKIVADIFTKYGILSIPVVDTQNKMLGMIVFDDIVDLIEENNTKEIYELGKMHIQDGEEIKYSNSNSFDLLRRRLGWLLFLLIFDFFTATVLKNYEIALSKVVALSFFVPMLLDTGGNAGAQVSVSIIRGLALGDVTLKNCWSIIKKEVIASLLMSLFVGIVAFIRAYLLQKSFSISFVVGSTMSLVVILAVLTGIALPILSKKIGLDPAVLAGPITTSIVDIAGLLIYFNIAIRLLPDLKGVF